jgi:hypothetical protein
VGELGFAIRTIARGDTYVGPRIASVVTRDYPKEKPETIA